MFEFGHIELSKRLIGEGLIDAPALFQICLGLSYGAPAKPQAMQAMLEQLPEGSHWSGFAIGRMEMPMVAQAMLFGGHLRVGLEDNLYLSRGVLASNADLVRRAKEVVESPGGRLAVLLRLGTGWRPEPLAGSSPVGSVGWSCQDRAPGLHETSFGS